MHYSSYYKYQPRTQAPQFQFSKRPRDNSKRLVSKYVCRSKRAMIEKN
jgi:hypothetical protein